MKVGLSDSEDKEDMFTILQREGEGEREQEKKIRATYLGVNYTEMC